MITVAQSKTCFSKRGKYYIPETHRLSVIKEKHASLGLSLVPCVSTGLSPLSSSQITLWLLRKGPVLGTKKKIKEVEIPRPKQHVRPADESKEFRKQQSQGSGGSPVLVQPHGSTCTPIIGATCSIHSRSNGAEARVCRR